jgi:hypothetical protein
LAGEVLGGDLREVVLVVTTENGDFFDGDGVEPESLMTLQSVANPQGALMR